MLIREKQQIEIHDSASIRERPTPRGYHEWIPGQGRPPSCFRTRLKIKAAIGYKPQPKILNQSKPAIWTHPWMKHGCPERMTICIRSTGETITLIDGLPVTLSAGKNPLMTQGSKAKNHELMVRQPVTLTCICEACKTQFIAKRNTAKYCSPRCRQRYKRDQEAQRQRREREQLLAVS